MRGAFRNGLSSKKSAEVTTASDPAGWSTARDSMKRIALTAAKLSPPASFALVRRGMWTISTGVATFMGLRTTAGGSSGSMSAVRVAISRTSLCAAGAESRATCSRRRRLELNPLGTCRGARPWLGLNANEDCKLPSRLLTRTASNAYFPQVVSVLSLPDRGSAVETAVKALWDDLQIVEDAAGLAFMKKKPKITERLAPFTDEEVLEAIQETKSGKAGRGP